MSDFSVFLESTSVDVRRKMDRSAFVRLGWDARIPLSGRKVTIMQQLQFPPNMRTSQAAKYLDVSESFLEKRRVFGGGPRYSKTGRNVIYRRSALDEWLIDSEVSNTSDLAAA